MPVLVTGIHVFMPPHANDRRRSASETPPLYGPPCPSSSVMPVLVTGIHVFMPPHANDCRQRSDKTIVAGNNNKRTGTQKRLQIAPQPSNISASITRYAAAQA